MRIIKLLKVNETIQQQLEESFEAMRENNVVLDTLSKSDGLTMTLNRRGFYQEAEKMLTEAREKQKTAFGAVRGHEQLKDHQRQIRT